MYAERQQREAGIRTMDLFIVLFLAICSVYAYGLPNLRSIWNIHQMTECYFNNNGIILLNYGCYCGAGGSGEPINEIDRCCMAHDSCYDKAISDQKCLNVLSMYVASYHWNCDNRIATCETNSDECNNVACKCDLEFITCLQPYGLPKESAICTEVKTTSKYSTTDKAVNLTTRSSTAAKNDASVIST
ncbi:unnamed protein product [Thelazia callipaeda]|uniref:Phospholipase A2 n=1 Tax=Thelazia callipaeda TaxID=103827 RepID=A0A0N5DC41_THECL|nr:unnamed protein product [Thelazia callipaeda]